MTIFLVRHGSAGVRNDADPDDAERHLDTVGRAQAECIARFASGEATLDGFEGVRPDIRRVFSSPAARCIETVAPAASVLGHEVQVLDAFFEGGSLDEAWDLIEGLALADGDSMVCSHGDLIPELIRRARLRGMLVPGKAGCSKGSIWALSWDGERFDEGTYTTTR